MIRLEAMVENVFKENGIEWFKLYRSGTTLYITTECGKSIFAIANEVPKRLTKEERNIILSKIEKFAEKHKDKLKRYIEMSKEAKEKREEFNKFVEYNELIYYGYYGTAPIKIILDGRALIVINKETGDISIKCKSSSYLFTENEIKQMLEELNKYKNLFKKALEIKKEYESIEEELEQIKFYKDKC